MKKTLVLLALLLALLLCGCVGADLSLPELSLPELSLPEREQLPPFARQLLDRFFPEAPPEDGVLIYRLSDGTDPSSRDLICTELCPLPTDQSRELEHTLSLFSAPAETGGLRCALPEGVSLQSFTRENRAVVLELSPEFLSADPMEQTLGAMCAALTLCELDSVESVTVTAGGQTLFTNLVPEDALLSDTDTDPYVRQLRLYFSDSQGRYLVSEYHTLALDEDSSPERYVMEELLRGPNSPDLKSTIPAGTRLISCTTVDGVCVVDLSAEFYNDRPLSATEERLCVFSVVNSLTALSGVDSVNLLVNGQPIQVYTHRSLSEPLSWYDRAIGPVSAAQEELDADIYLVTPDMTAITALPFRVALAGHASRAEAVLNTLLNAAEPGYPAPFSGSGSVTDLAVQGPFCTIDLSESFFASLPPESRAAAVQSIAATLCDLPEISSVTFTIGGEPAVYEGTDWSGPWTHFTEIEVY